MNWKTSNQSKSIIGLRLEGGLSSFSVPDDNPLAFFLRLPARVPRWVLAFNPLFDCLLSSSNSEWFKIWSPLIEFDTFLYRRISSLLYCVDVWDIHQIVRSELISVFAKFEICSSLTTQDKWLKAGAQEGVQLHSASATPHFIRHCPTGTAEAFIK